MFRTITISGFRAIEHLKLTSLERVNLVVGTNNSGKTSVLEAIELLTAGGAAAALHRALGRRGELVFASMGPTPRLQVIDITQLFHAGTDASALLATVVGTRTGNSGSELQLELAEEPSEPDDDAREDEEFSGSVARTLAVRFWDGRTSAPREYRLALHGRRLVGAYRPSDLPAEPYEFVTTASLTEDEVVSLFDSIALGEHEEIVLTALRIIEPDLLRIATVASSGPNWSASYARAIVPRRGGIVVNVKNRPPRLPIASMGDGMWRLLGLALSLVHSRGGVLLVDEIDTGLHHTVMVQMWRLVIETAEKLDVQVFATTHSSDCWTSLAQVIEERRAEGRSTSAAIHRLERGRPYAVTFSEPEIVVAAQRELEVR